MKRSILLLFLYSACTAQVQTTSTEVSAEAEISNQLGGAVLWYQNSAEMKLSYYQSYQYAKMMLDNKLERSRLAKPAAVVLDIDETVLDNSPYEAQIFDKGETYKSESWHKWTEEARAAALPGALDFVEYAKSRGVEVFYISNRSVSELEPTIKNLKKEKFPNASEEFVMLKSETSDKTERRNKVLESHTVLVYVGDNLTDYSELFADRDKNMGKDLVEKYKDELLSNFVMLPNPMYGEWEGAIYDNNYGLSDDLKLKKRKEALIK
ncbi:5'-nucleotidase, lipoprotein e(P4) family [Fulvivirga lutimaris]|uniref:5'-nucleotidase, lipoprotein e(P4) family n=1 Tax=Fulvivirga lutimaris TaxID=1819566 RepID=UPI0012BBA835|nr:5'-nucleotidase, lipoprotein e(P4) family [Fulvivirga lutimaris]MTI39592.1 5'-nucleotidase, lipoprotein e(P4) family [Fulvivirga lutimaris]